MGAYDGPRYLLGKVPGIEILEFRDSREEAVCCGGGGGVKSGNRDLANNLGRKRMEEAACLNVRAVVTSCPFCELNLEENGSIPVLDVVEIVAKSLKGEQL
jgi:Fe-S oxidoreductase